MKTPFHLLAAALSATPAVAVVFIVVFSEVAFAEKDFLGLPVTPKPATPKPVVPAAPPAVAKIVQTPEDEIAVVVQRYKEGMARQDAEETKAAASTVVAYVKELEKLRDATKAKGQLEALIEAETALKAAQAGEEIPPGKLLAPALAQARANYERAREFALHPYAPARQRLNADYDRMVAELVAKFTRAGNLETAKQAREARRILLTVDTLVDGPSTLNIRKDGLYWVNGGNAKPGPTYVDGKKWEMRWGKPDQARGADKTDTRPITLPSADLKVDLVSLSRERGQTGVEARTAIEIKPHGNELQITIPDPEAGPRWYKLTFRER